MLAILSKGGIVMYLILFISLVGVVIIVERLLFFRRIRIDEDKMINRMRVTLEKHHFDEALAICENNPSPFSSLMRIGIENRIHDTRLIKELILEGASQEIPALEKFLSSLGTIAHVAPLLGLLGTVTGNIRAFGILGSFGAVGDPSLLAKGISEALLTTAAGIIVAIPTLAFYNYLVSKVNHLIIRMENRVNEMILILKGGGE
jgi:biopolymer transport protein ExbB